MVARWSVVRRTRVSMLAVAALSVVVVFVAFYAAWTAYTVRLRTDELVRQTTALARGLPGSGEVFGGSEEGPALRDLRARLFRVQAGLIGAQLAVTDAEGEVLASSLRAEERAVDSYPLERFGEPDADGVCSRALDLDPVGRVLAVAVPVGAEDERFLVALQPVTELNATRGGVAALLAASAALALAVAWLAGFWLANRLSGPLLRLREATEAVESGEWGRQVRVEGDDEVAGLAQSFNRMSSRVADAYRAQKEFTGNVSHELRTPLTSIQGFATAMLDGTATDDETRERYLSVIRDEAVRLADMSRTLLSLADLDAGVVEPVSERVVTAAVVDALRARYEPVAWTKGVELAFGRSEGAFRGDGTRAVQAASTLLENALEYTPAGGMVRVDAFTRDESWVLEVADSGPGVPPGERDRVFERFARLEGSRSTRSRGSGLGLAICRQLVELMGGSVRADDSDMGGALFHIELPVNPRSST